MRRHDVHLVFNQIESEKELGNVQTVGKCDKMQNGTVAREKRIAHIHKHRTNEEERQEPTELSLNFVSNYII